MTRNLASVLTITSTAAAACAFAAIACGPVYAAGDITVDPTPFVSTKTRAEVMAEVTGQAEALRVASSELAMQATPRASSGFTRAQAKADYIAARSEVNALNAEDSGSSYLARMARLHTHDTILAGTAN